MFASSKPRFSNYSRSIVFAILLSGTGRTPAAGDLRAFDYATPAYLDFEFARVRVQETSKVAVVHVIRTGDFRQTTTVQFKTEEITAIGGKDFEEMTGTLVFRPGEGYKTIDLRIISDEESEPDETFRLRLFADSPNAVLMRDFITIEVYDGSSSPVLNPKLEISPAGAGRISLSWNFDPDFTLERSPDPSHGEWEVVTDEPLLNETRCELIEETHGRLYFFRLHARQN